MRSALSGVTLAAVLGLSSGCTPGASEATDAAIYDYTAVNTGPDTKALIYNLIGRWYPVEEIARLDDDSMTPEAFCAREPSMLTVLLDDVEIQCDQGASVSVAIARVERSAEGGIHLAMRAKEEELKHITFKKVLGSTAVIAGSPCYGGKDHDYARFPKYEVLQRQILGGRRCAQIIKDSARILPKPEDPLE